LNGYWVIDAKASAEEFNKLPIRSTNDFISLAGWMFLFAYEFKDEVLTFGTVAGDKSARFQLLATPREDTQFTYKPEVQKGTDDGLLVVSATSSDHIRIAVSNHDFTKYFLYKRVKLDPNAREQNANTAKAALKEFADILKRQQ
jgi:hypothetical protein